MLMGTACAARGKIRLSALGYFAGYMERGDVIRTLEQREQALERNIRYRC